jgi:Spermine/spermidine synthase domain
MPHRQRGAGREPVREAIDSGLAELVADPDRPEAWTLLIDGAPQSHVDLADPAHLEFGYMRQIGHLIDLTAPAGAPLRVLHLGGGGLTLARYVAATRPRSSQVAVEADAALVELVRRRLPLQARVRVRTGDARAVLEGVRAGSFDLVIADVFADRQTPAHVTSAEFAAAVARALDAEGSYAVNISDGPPLARARAWVTTAGSVFPHAALMADTAVLRGRRPGNLVGVASRRELPFAGLARRMGGGSLPGRLVHGPELERFAGGARPITDASGEPTGMT